MNLKLFTSHYNGISIDFDRWEQEYNCRERDRAAVIRAHLMRGGRVRQLGYIWPECSPFLPQYNTPRRLAEHIANREFRFGFTTEILR